jgi:hypothetical protein
MQEGTQDCRHMYKHRTYCILFIYLYRRGIRQHTKRTCLLTGVRDLTPKLSLPVSVSVFAGKGQGVFVSGSITHSKPFFAKLIACDIKTASNNYKIYGNVSVFASCVNFKSWKTTLPTV